MSGSKRQCGGGEGTCNQDLGGGESETSRRKAKYENNAMKLLVW